MTYHFVLYLFNSILSKYALFLLGTRTRYITKIFNYIGATSGHGTLSVHGYSNDSTSLSRSPVSPPRSSEGHDSSISRNKSCTAASSLFATMRSRTITRSSRAFASRRVWMASRARRSPNRVAGVRRSSASCAVAKRLSASNGISEASNSD